MGLHIVQIPGLAVRIDRSWFEKVIHARPRALNLIHRHTFALMRQILFGATCNRLHSMKERCARWMLMTHDRASQDEFPLTQDFLAHMLGVRRATVNLATGMLKKAGIIRYVRGHVTLMTGAAWKQFPAAAIRQLCVPTILFWATYNITHRWPSLGCGAGRGSSVRWRSDRSARQRTHNRHRLYISLLKCYGYTGKLGRAVFLRMAY